MSRWIITPQWEGMDSGSPEENATFAAIKIVAGKHVMSSVYDRLVDTVRDAPYLSGYHLAEWFAWNWWRLCWEPDRQRDLEWRMSHGMVHVGGGYVWPDLEFVSDGSSVSIRSRPSPDDSSVPYRYVSSAQEIVALADFERGLESFVECVLDRLGARGVTDNNLAVLWGQLLSERQDPELSYLRKLEAMLGSDPGEFDEAVLRRMVDDAGRVGVEAMQELAAGHKAGEPVVEARMLEDAAESAGVAVRADLIRAVDTDKPEVGGPPWVQGAAAAQAVRAKHGLGLEPLPDSWLADMFALPSGALENANSMQVVPGMAFLLKQENALDRLVFRSKHMQGRRFELARLLGDVVFGSYADESLRPATRGFTWRQKVQRAFAAELLGPFEGIDGALDGDYSAENRQEVASYFGVSEWVVSRHLVNHGRTLEDESFERAA